MTDTTILWRRTGGKTHRVTIARGKLLDDSRNFDWAAQAVAWEWHFGAQDMAAEYYRQAVLAQAQANAGQLGTLGAYLPGVIGPIGPCFWV